jgi:hypothetical protein
LKLNITASTLFLISTLALSAVSPQGRAKYKEGDRVEVDLIEAINPANAIWKKGTIIKVNMDTAMAYPFEIDPGPGKKFDCLPKDVRLAEVVSYGGGGKENITVEKKLLEMKARCRNGKLVDARNKEIRFFRGNCWGSPPRDYLEILKRKRQELEKLKKTYSVIEIMCNPMIP